MPSDATEAHLSHLALGVAAPGAVAAFYERVVGLSIDERLPGDVVRLGWGQGFHALELRPGTGIHHVGLALPDAGAIERLAGRLRGRDVAVDELPAGDGHPEGITFRDPDGNTIEAHGPVDRSGEHNADPGRRPVRIHHVTFATPDVAAMVAFYESALGFRVSDRMGDVFVWMRCNREHHTIAVVQAPEAGLDHYAYELDSWGDLKTWCDELAVRDVPITWGPGRHGPGNNLFVMFDDAAGHRVELCCEMERYWDDVAEYVPRRWAPGAKTINLWGPAPAWRDRLAS